MIVAGSAATVADSAATVAALAATVAASAADAGSTGVTAGRRATDRRAHRAMKPRSRRIQTWRAGNGSATGTGAPAIFPAPQELPVLGRRRTEDRLQGRPASVAIHFRARQDRSEPDHGGERKAAAGARAGDQALALSRPIALCHEVS